MVVRNVKTKLKQLETHCQCGADIQISSDELKLMECDGDKYLYIICPHCHQMLIKGIYFFKQIDE